MAFFLSLHAFILRKDHPEKFKANFIFGVVMILQHKPGMPLKKTKTAEIACDRKIEEK